MNYKIILTGPNISQEREITQEQAAEVMRALVMFEPESEEEEEAEEKAQEHLPRGKYKKHRKERTCSLCGKPGHQRTTCPKDSEPAEADAGLLTKEEFNSVRECKEDGLKSKDTAESLGLNRKEVNVAYGSYDYDSYLSSRE